MFYKCATSVRISNGILQGLNPLPETHESKLYTYSLCVFYVEQFPILRTVAMILQHSTHLAIAGIVPRRKALHLFYQYFFMNSTFQSGTFFTFSLRWSSGRLWWLRSILRLFRHCCEIVLSRKVEVHWLFFQSSPLKGSWSKPSQSLQSRYRPDGHIHKDTPKSHSLGGQQNILVDS